MDSFDYELVAITIVVVLLGLALLYLVARSFKKIWDSRGLNSGRSAILTKLAALVLAAGLIIAAHFWLFNPHDAADSVSYNPAGIEGGVALMVLGVILTYIILPFRRQKADKTKWPWPRRHKITSFFCLILVVALGVLVYQRLALRANRNNFTQARAAIDTVYADIVQQVGQPDNFKRTNFCSRSHEEFSEGTLSCSTNTNFIYGVDNEQQANQTFKQIQAVISKYHASFTPTQLLSSKISDTLVVDDYYRAAGDSYKNGHLMCNVNYVFNTPREIDLAINDSSKLPLEVTIGCYGPARAQYYPLEN